ncbi:MAG: glutaredoxin domain-containing protein [Deltaproteobacteria bacterium]
MDNTLFTATGCGRCKIAKKFMDEHGIPYQEMDIKADGKEPFAQFYRNNRSSVHRGRDGIEFPVFTDGTSIRQGVGVVIAFLDSGTRLDGFIDRSELSHGWMDGIHVSEGNPAFTDDLVKILGFLKKNGLKLQFDTNGKNASVLLRLLEQGLGDRVIMDLKGPLDLYSALLGEEIDPQEIRRTIELVTRFSEYRFETTVVPVFVEGGESESIRYLTPEEIGQAAKWVKEVTGSNKQPYLLRVFDPETSLDQKFKSIGKLDPNALLRYRSAARRHLVLAEVQKI